MTRHVKSGEGWRMGWDEEAEVHCGLVGGDRWSVELTAAEFEDFCRLLLHLERAVREISQELMESEKVSCEVETDLIWMEAEGDAAAYAIHFILLTGRRAEGTWEAIATPHLIQAAQTLKVF